MKFLIDFEMDREFKSEEEMIETYEDFIWDRLNISCFGAIMSFISQNMKLTKENETEVGRKKGVKNE